MRELAEQREAGGDASIRRVVLIVNPRSGRGRAERLARELAGALEEAEVRIERVDVHAPGASETLERTLAHGERTAAVVVGGDGTVHTHADALARLGAPVYHAPTGTENLFAREFGMQASAAAVLEALRSGRTSRVDLAHCETEGAGTAQGKSGEIARGGARETGESVRAFLIMAGIGFDAGVIHRLAAARRGAITHLTYLGPIARESLTHRAPVQRVEVDGLDMVDGRRGLVIVANSRQYASRLDPAPRANMRDGQLDVVFFPARTAVGLGLWCALARLRWQARWPGLVTGRGREVRVRAEDGRALLQLDGEAVGPGDAREGAWRFGVDAGALVVLGG